jgi:hypothetical protein
LRPINPFYYNILHIELLRRNPPVTIEDWPDPDLNPDIDDDDDDELAHNLNEPLNDPDRDPEYIERAQSPILDPIDVPLLTNDEIRRLLEEEFGDLADDEWVDVRKFSHLVQFSSNFLIAMC